MKRDDLYSLSIANQAHLHHIVNFFKQYSRYHNKIDVIVNKDFPFSPKENKKNKLYSNLIIRNDMKNGTPFYQTSSNNDRNSLLLLVEYLAESYTSLSIDNTDDKYSYYYASNQLRIFNHQHITGNTPVFTFKENVINALNQQEYDYYFSEQNDERISELFDKYDTWYAGRFHTPMLHNVKQNKYIDYFFQDLFAYQEFNALREKEDLSEIIQQTQPKSFFRI